MSFSTQNEQGAFTGSNGTVLSAYEAEQQIKATFEAVNAADAGGEVSDLEARLNGLLGSDTQEPVPVEQEAVEPGDVSPSELKSLSLKVDPVEKEELEQLNALLAKRYGITTEEFESRSQAAQQAEQANAVQGLQKEWGVDAAEFDNRLTQIKQAFNKLPEDMQDALDNPLGAKLIWASIQNAAPKAVTPPSIVEKSTGSKAGTQSKFTFTQSEILSMSPAAYNKNQAAILEAFSRGLVDTSR